MTMNRQVHKTKYLCVDGPFRGQRILLSGDGKSLVFKLKGQVGRYVPNGAASVRWEPVQ
jgi:hypothetical protein